MFKNKFILLILTTSLLMSCSRSLHQQGTASNWFAQSNIYEVNLRQYTASGTIKEFQTHLPRLRAMGVEILWFMPVTPIGLKERKMTPAELGSYYAVRNYTAINPEFGTMADWKALVNDAHQRGFKVIIDWVPNHTAADHPWLTSNPDFYEKDAKGEPVIPYDWTDVRQLDYSNKKLRDSMFNAIKFWVQETGVDGFRVDQAFKIDLNFWQRTIPELNKIRSLFWLAESDPAEHTNLFADGLFHAGYTWKWMHKTREFYQNKLPLSALEEVLQTYNNSKGIKMWFTSNHDENSWNGTEFEKYGAMADALAVFSSTWKGIPLIYSGQEVPNTRRLKFFVRDPIQWTHFKMAPFYSTLLKLRKSTPALAVDASNTRLTTTNEQAILGYVREKEGRKVSVLLNLSDKPQTFNVTSSSITGSAKNVFTGVNENLSTDKIISVPAWGYLVYDYGR